MERLRIALLWCTFATICAGLAAQSKPEEVPFQDALLVSFKTVSTGASCSSTGNGTVSDQGAIQGTATTTCSEGQTNLYTLKVGDSLFTLEPTITGKRSAGDAAMVIGTLGYGALFIHHKQALANQLPGAHVLIRSRGSSFEVRAANRTSLYRLVGAQ